MNREGGNVFSDMPVNKEVELFQRILEGRSFHTERIVSFGQATAPGQWHDQDGHEWVIVLSGSAGLRFDDEDFVRSMGPGDFVKIRAHRKHRVEWTAPNEPTVWLAIHYQE